MPLSADPDLAILHDDLLARHAPADAAERHWVEELAFALWRQRRLRDAEARLLAAAFPAGTNEPEPDAASPTLRLVLRCRARIERDIRLAEARLAALCASRPRPARRFAGSSAAQFRWLAARAAEREAAAGASVAVVANVNEPEPAVPAAPAPEAARTNPTPAATPPLNRHERRRLAAVERRAAG